MIAMIVGAIVGVAAGIAAEPVVRRLPAAVEDATQQPPWTRAIRRPPVMELVGAALGALVGYRIGWHGALVPSLVLVAAVVPIV